VQGSHLMSSGGGDARKRGQMLVFNSCGDLSSDSSANSRDKLTDVAPLYACTV